MSWFPRAEARPVGNHGGEMNTHLGLVLHIMQGTLDGTDAWFHAPESQVSAHFGNGRDGKLFQWVDTAYQAWAQAAGNADYLSIENEGRAGDELTSAQIENVAQVMVWAGIPAAYADHPGEAGLGWHGMGGVAWGNHPNCPGDPIVAQRGIILDRVRELYRARGQGQETVMSGTVYNPPIPSTCASLKDPTSGGVWLLSPNGAVYAIHGAPYLGGANGKPYFKGRVAMNLELAQAEDGSRSGYVIVATSGERYGPVF